MKQYLKEWESFIVFVLSLLFFSSIELYYCGHIDTNTYWCPEARSYDTFYYLHLINNSKADFWLIRHPLFVQFYMPLNTALGYLGLKMSLFPYLIVTNMLLSSTNLLLDKIMIEEKIAMRIRIAMLLLFCSFAHVILLATQVESFTITMFVSVLTVYLFITKRSSFIWDNILYALMTGTTSTNAFKFLLMKGVLAYKERWSVLRYFANVAKATILFLLLWLYPLYGLVRRLFSQGFSMNLIMGDTLDYITSMDDRLLMFVNGFICDPICFHSDNIAYYNPHGDIGPYISFWLYIPILLIYGYSLYGLYKYKSDFAIELMFCCFITDFFFNQIVGYGINQSWIVCGGWFFILPILIGKTLNGLNNKNRRRLSTILFFCISLFLLYYNIFLIIKSLSYPNPYS